MAFPLQDVVQLGAVAMIVLAGPVDVDGVGPGGYPAVVFAADQAVAKAASAWLPRHLACVPHQRGPGFVGHEKWPFVVCAPARDDYSRRAFGHSQTNWPSNFGFLILDFGLKRPVPP